MASLNIMGKPIDQPYEPGDEQWHYRRSRDPEPRQRRCGSPDNMEGMARHGLRATICAVKFVIQHRLPRYGTPTPYWTSVMHDD